MSGSTLPRELLDPVHEQRALLRRRLVAMRRLESDLLRTSGKLPAVLDAAALDDADARDVIAAWVQRYGLLVDLVAASMKALVAYEGNRVDSFLDVLAAMVKLGVVDDESAWRGLRALRNRLAHEYEVDATRLARDLVAGQALLPVLRGILARFEARCVYAVGPEDVPQRPDGGRGA